MKILSLVVSLSAVAFVSGAAIAQTTPAPKPAAKPAAKAAATTKPAATAKAPTKRAPLARSAAKAVEEVTPIEEDSDVVLSEADLAVSQRVYLGKIPCELGSNVEITPSKKTGFFVIQAKNTRYFMHPVESRTGAIRLEDPKRGAMWLQLGNKSMLMSQKLGARLADECMSPEQLTLADEMKRNPPRSLLEPLDPPTAPPAVIKN
ncbi:hypothetical protein [Hydrogenophaga sp.]|uniref:hypothetical protein n=1 Tax=Hydrogenophaga sp. TaxID=1904254 RepID=UPI00271AE0AE|nr:hypothetical protein [Hydrogenophaga sp.]MDO9434638.1 hypothetical protein [Hydrogenophaga sp.]